MHLDLRLELPKIRAAYNAGELEAQKIAGEVMCHYAGPCAIGVCLPEDTRVSLDTAPEGQDGTSFGSWVERGVLSCAEGQYADWTALQLEHDNWTSSQEDYFGQLLTQLEIKYDPRTSEADRR